MSYGLEALRLELIGAHTASAITNDLVDDIVAALERAERIEAAATGALDKLVKEGVMVTGAASVLRAALESKP